MQVGCVRVGAEKWPIFGYVLCEQPLKGLASPRSVHLHRVRSGRAVRRAALGHGSNGLPTTAAGGWSLELRCAQRRSRVTAVAARGSRLPVGGLDWT